MTLSFSQTINGKTNFFIEKIWEGIFPVLPGNTSEQYLFYQESYLHKFLGYWDGTGDMVYEPVNPKLHTIREDKSNRWGAGTDVHFVINNRTKNRFQFAPVIKCKSVQEIQILNCNYLPMDYFYESVGYLEKIIVRAVEFINYWKIWIGDKNNGRFLSIEQIKQLAINDGFDSVDDFFAYFNKDFTGKIIHINP